MLKTTEVSTKYSIINCVISGDSSRAILITKKSEHDYYIVQYNLETTCLTFKEKFGGKPESYIKMQEIIQNNKGDLYAVAYYDNGYFKIRTFGKQTRKCGDIAAEEFDINSAIGITAETIPNAGNSDPFITIDFIDDQSMFVSLFHNKSMTHWHFIYNFREKKI